jgi:hypothetical protein
LSGPKRAVAINPIRRIPHWSGVENTSADASVTCASHETGVFEDTKMLGDRRPRHPERFGQFADRRFAKGEPTENRPSRAVGEGSERTVEARVTGNHSVTNLARAAIVVKFDVAVWDPSLKQLCDGPRMGGELPSIASRLQVNWSVPSADRR